MADKAAIEALLVETAKLAPAKLPGFDAVVGLDLAGEGGGQWTLKFVAGALTTAEGIDPAATATLKLSANDFEALCRKQLNPMSAFMSGRLKVVGNMAVVMRLQALFQ
jgi:putative sterol carrier protein